MALSAEKQAEAMEADKPKPKPEPTPNANDPKYAGLAGRARLAADQREYDKRNPKPKKPGTTGQAMLDTLKENKTEVATTEVRKVWNSKTGQYEDKQVPKKK